LGDFLTQHNSQTILKQTTQKRSFVNSAVIDSAPDF